MTAKNSKRPLKSQDATRTPHSAYFPRRFLTDFFEFLRLHHDTFQILTYADLPWGNDVNYKRNYPGEWRNWQRQLAHGERDPDKIYIVVQYDVDSRPERTLALLREPAHEFIPVNIMIFNRRVDRKRLKRGGELGCIDYTLDFEFLKRLEDRGFVIGYHTNAYELSGFVVARALDIFDADVKELSRHFQIRHFSAHGGVPDSKGRNNRHLPFHPNWVSKLKWVHNGHGVRFDGHFSDGGHNSMRNDPLHRDLRAFVSKMKRGGRYGVLLHPQYYGDELRVSPRFRGTTWYDELIQADRSPATCSLWENVRVGTGSILEERMITNKIRTRLQRWI